MLRLSRTLCPLAMAAALRIPTAAALIRWEFHITGRLNDSNKNPCTLFALSCTLQGNCAGGEGVGHSIVRKALCA